MPKIEPVTKISSFSRTEIAQLFKKARIAVRCTGLRILIAPTDNPRGRVLIVTPKVSGTSPERNLFRRRIRAVFRELSLFDYSKDFVVIANKRCIAFSFAKLKHLMLCAAREQLHD